MPPVAKMGKPHRLAIVLGGGGERVVAWQIGVLAGEWSRDADPRLHPRRHRYGESGCRIPLSHRSGNGCRQNPARAHMGLYLSRCRDGC